MAERDLDVVVFGATSVTGRRVAAYLADRAPETGASWAAAGRDAAKVANVLAEEGVSAPETLVAEVDDPASLAAMAARAKVVLNLVGPYTLYGQPVIEACADAGTHYVDLTGEIPFVRKIIDELDGRARESGAKIVQVCGFEALPPDLAVALAADAARERWGEELAEVDLEVSIKGSNPGLPRPSDIISGGTLQSLLAVMRTESDHSVSDPACLIEDPVAAEAVRKVSPISVLPRRNDRGAVIAPMAPAAFINPAVIHRTAALRAANGLTPLRYREGIALGGPAVTLPLRFAGAGLLSGTQAGLAAIAGAPSSVRRRIADALGKVTPGSGFGPAADRLEAWSFRVRVDARTAAGHEVEVKADAEGHPGYLATARMMGEAGLMLAEPGVTPDGSGCLTPAVALGTARVDRFERAKLKFSVAP